ncbi:hypothetical protein Tco_1520243, partial [Tanacetum coccineum]
VSNEPVLLNTPLSEKVECFVPEDNNDEINDFLAMEVSSSLEEGYFDSEGDVIFLDNLLSDDNSHNLASEGNVQANQNSVIESLPIEDSEPTQEEIDILLVPYNLIPPGVEDDDSEDEVNEPNLDHQDDPSIPRPPPEPPDIKKCFELEAGILIIKEFKVVSKSYDFMTGILPTLVSDLTFISSFVSFENEDTIFDPGIST